MAIIWQTAVQLALALISLVLIVLRIYVRVFISHDRRPWWSYLGEVFLLVAWICFVVPIGVDLSGIWDKEANPATDTVAIEVWLDKWVYSWWITIIVGFYSIKAAVLIFYVEWIPRSLPKCWWANMIVIAFTFSSFMVSAGLYTFWCWPISRNWKFEPNHIDLTDCNTGGSDPAWYCRFAFHLSTDLLIYALPIYVVHSLPNITRGEKLRATGMFIIGGFNIFWAVLAFSSNQIPLPDETIFVFQDFDRTSGIFIACAPALRVLVRRCWACWGPKQVESAADSGSGVTSNDEKHEHSDGVSVASGDREMGGHRSTSTSISNEEMKLQNLGLATIEEAEMKAGPSAVERCSTVPSTLKLDV